MSGVPAGGPLKPDFGLSGAVLPLDKVFPPLVAQAWATRPTVPGLLESALEKKRRCGLRCSPSILAQVSFTIRG